MYRKIIVALDGSTLAEAILPHAIALARSLRAEITLFRVPEYEGLPTARGLYKDVQICTAEERAAAIKETVRYLNQVKERLDAHGLTVFIAFREGLVGERISQFARLSGSDLIAMSTNGKTGLRRVLLGSVAEQVLRDARSPVLVLRPSADQLQGKELGKSTLTYHRILVPLDGSGRAEEILSSVQTMARATGARIILFRVPEFAPTPAVVGPSFSIPWPVLTNVASASAQKAAEEYLTTVRDRLTRYGLQVEATTGSGSVGDAIVRFADEAAIDLIAMSTQGLTGPARLLLGSVAEHVLRETGKPLLLMRTR